MIAIPPEHFEGRKMKTGLVLVYIEIIVSKPSHCCVIASRIPPPWRVKHASQSRDLFGKSVMLTNGATIHAIPAARASRAQLLTPHLMT